MKKLTIILGLFMAMGFIAKVNAQSSIWVGIEEKAWVASDGSVWIGIEEKAYASGSASIQRKGGGAAYVLGLLN